MRRLLRQTVSLNTHIARGKPVEKARSPTTLQIQSPVSGAQPKTTSINQLDVVILTANVSSQAESLTPKFRLRSEGTGITRRPAGRSATARSHAVQATVASNSKTRNQGETPWSIDRVPHRNVNAPLARACSRLLGDNGGWTDPVTG